MAERWPAILWIVRHGESAANVASQAAHAAGEELIGLAGRDVDVPLSARGIAQADALGDWFAHQSRSMRPDVILSSPYLRARDTAARLKLSGVPVLVDERLRERELGILDGLTWPGIVARHPEQAAQRDLLGKFYHRPPGGENWCDVILRLRGVMDRISLHHAGERVMIVAHEVVVFCLRYIIEDMDEATVLGIDARGDVANCALTEYAHVAGKGLMLERFNDTDPLDRAGAPVTVAREPIAAARG